MIKRPPKLHKKGAYYYLVFYEPWRGSSRKWKAMGTTSRARANQLLREITELYFKGQYHPWGITGSQSVSESAYAFLKLKSTVSKDRTMRSLREVLEPLEAKWGSLLLSELGPKAVMELCYNGEVSNQTIKRRLTTVKGFLRWCSRLGMEIDETVLALESPRVARRPPRFLSREEYEKLLKTFPLGWARDAWLLGLSTGMRPIDVTRLKWENVKEDRIEIMLSKYDGYSVPLFQVAREVLGSLPPTNLYVITNSLGRVPRPDRISAAFKKAREKAELDPITLYEATRHTFASWLVQKGIDIYQVSKWMGHKDVKTTMIYAHLRPGIVPEEAYEVFKWMR